MAVTEIALLNSKHPLDDQSAAGISSQILEKLCHAASEQAAYSGYPVALLQCREDPTQLFLLGGWKSVSHHMNDWIPGSVNQELLKLLSSDIDVKWMFHLDTEPLHALETARSMEVDGAVEATLGLYIVGDDQRSVCEAHLRAGISSSGFAGFRKAFSAWRLDLGYVADGNEPEMQEVEKTLVLLAADVGGDESIQTSILEKLDFSAQKGIVHSVRVISFVQTSRY